MRIKRSFVKFLYERDGIEPKESDKDLIENICKEFANKNCSEGSDSSVIHAAAALSAEIYLDSNKAIRLNRNEELLKQKGMNDFQEFIKTLFNDDGINSESQEKSKPTYNAR